VAIPPGYATALWPPSGIAVAALLLGGSRLWPAVWVGSFAANVNIEAAWLTAAVIATGSSVQSVAIAGLLRRQKVFAYTYEGRRYDCGSKEGFLEANIELGLAHPQIGPSLRAYLKDLAL